MYEERLEMALFDKKDDVFELMERFEKGSIMELELEASEGMRIRLSKVNPVSEPVYLPIPRDSGTSAVMHHFEDAPIAGGQAANASAGEPEAAAGNVIKAPIIGTFYMSASPEAAPYVKIGDKVAKGAVICILEAMKVMNEIECEQDCEIVEVLAKNGDQIEYGQPLFRIK